MSTRRLYTEKELEGTFLEGFVKGKDKGQGKIEIDPYLAFVFHLQSLQSKETKEI